MISPYRTSAAPIERLISLRPWYARATTRVKRKTLVWWKGSFKNRNPIHCNTCRVRIKDLFKDYYGT